MPEGQVSHRNALRLTAALAGRELTRVEAPEPRLAAQRIPERLAGDRVAVVEAAGKHHLIRFESGRTLHSHLMMSGVWRLLPAAVPAAPRGAVAGALDRGRTWPRSTGGRCSGCWSRASARGRWTSLGPDLLDEAVDPGGGGGGPAGARRAGRQVGEALMDQRVVAGIGNVYKSETCFLCGVDPWRPVGGSEPAGGGRSRRHRGAADGRRRAPRRAHHHLPAAGRPARVPGDAPGSTGAAAGPAGGCGTPIRARGQGDGNRTTYWCPACQA